MTLIITEISEYGIAMVADSALTWRFRHPSAGLPRTLMGVRKLQQIPHLRAGISFWGCALLPTAEGDSLLADDWMRHFVQQHADTQSLDEFAETLVQKLQATASTIGEPVGFHLGGYAQKEDQSVPTLYHVRNCDGNALEGYKLHEFVKGLEWPQPQEEKTPPPFWLRNGDYGAYAILFRPFDRALSQIEQLVTKTPIPARSLEGRMAYNALWVRLISDLYASAELPQTIGGEIYALGIGAGGEIISWSK